jgi:predicted kinase
VSGGSYHIIKSDDKRKRLRDKLERIQSNNYDQAVVKAMVYGYTTSLNRGEQFHCSMSLIFERDN